jgi:hypothetical protein
VYGVARFRAAGDYPGSVLVSDHSLYHGAPRLSVRRDTVYRTSDPFPRVYNYYSNGFDLGPEQRAQSSCILMADAVTHFRLVATAMSVTLCDTPSGRMIFVMRSVGLRFR